MQTKLDLLDSEILKLQLENLKQLELVVQSRSEPTNDAQNLRGEFSAALNQLKRDLSKTGVEFSTSLNQLKRDTDVTIAKEVQLSRATREELIKLQQSLEALKLGFNKRLELVQHAATCCLYYHRQLTTFVYLWTIDNVNEHVLKAKKAESLHSRILMSAPFCLTFTKYGGYKLCAQLYPNGDNTVLGKHVSIYLMLLQSETDLLQPWPFQTPVTIEVINLSDKSKNVFKTLVPDPKEPYAQRPTPTSPPFGIHELIPCAALSNSTFVREDKMFIKFYTN